MALKEVNAPSAEATTMLIHARGLLSPSANTTVHMINAVVKFSAIGEVIKSSQTVTQNNCR